MAEVFDVLSKVKTSLGITGEFQDETLKGYIDEVKEFLLDAGVKPAVVNAETSAGVITRGVADLWNYGSGNAELSPYFFQRASQLVYKGRSSDDSKDASAVKVRTIMLLSSAWIASNGSYSQVVAIDGITKTSKIDLQPTPAQLSQLLDDEIALTAVNDSGIVTVYAIGEKPTIDFVMQVTITEVMAE